MIIYPHWWNQTPFGSRLSPPARSKRHVDTATHPSQAARAAAPGEGPQRPWRREHRRRNEVQWGWLQWKSTGNHRFSNEIYEIYEIWDFPVFFPSNQSIEHSHGLCTINGDQLVPCDDASPGSWTVLDQRNVKGYYMVLHGLRMVCKLGFIN